MTRISVLTGTGDEAITELLDAAFGPDRHGRTAYRIRMGMAWLTDLSFAAYDAEDQLLGTVQCWPVALHGPDGAQTPLIMVGPVAVRPHMQRHGTGRALMDKLIETVDLHPGDPLMMIGDPEYYGRFWGFVPQGTDKWQAPGPFEHRRLLVRPAPGMTLPATGMLGPRTSALAESVQGADVRSQAS